MIQRRAMIEGGQFAYQINDPRAGAWHILQASYITGNTTDFWSSSSSLILPTTSYNSSVSKPANIDSQVFLAALHAAVDDDLYTVDSDRMIYTFVVTVANFNSLYPINANTTAVVSSTTIPIGVAMGRYSEDTYNRYNSDNKGNPWSLSPSLGSTTFTEILNNVFTAGGRYMARVASHTTSD
ncbi:hypothetical protein FBU59_000974, partial [Linderina macrospora]